MYNKVESIPSMKTISLSFILPAIQAFFSMISGALRFMLRTVNPADRLARSRHKNPVRLLIRSLFAVMLVFVMADTGLANIIAPPDILTIDVGQTVKTGEFRATIQGSGSWTVSAPSRDEVNVKVVDKTCIFGLSNCTFKLELRGLQPRNNITIEVTASKFGRSVSRNYRVHVRGLLGNDAYIDVDDSTLNLYNENKPTREVKLSREPTSDVTVKVSSADENVMTVSPSSLRFSKSNWSVPQTLTFEGTDVATTTDVRLNLTAESGGYHGKTAGFDVRVHDTQGPGLIVDRNPLIVQEGDTDGIDLTIRLQALPDADVFVVPRIEGSDKVDFLPNTSLTFPRNPTGLDESWDDPQTLKITAKDDADGRDETLTVVLQISGGFPNYGNLPSVRIPVTVDDDEGRYPPGKPIGLDAVPGDAQVELKWTGLSAGTQTNPVSPPAKWEMRYRSGDDDWGDWFELQCGNSACPGSTRSYTVSGLDNDKEYTFQWRARNGNDELGPSTHDVKATPTAKSTKPDLAVEPRHGHVVMSWTTQAGVNRWLYRQKEESTDYGSWKVIAGSGASTDGHTVTGLTNSTAHTFQVRADKQYRKVVNEDGTSTTVTTEGEVSDEVTVTPRIVKPGKPTALTATAGVRQVMLSWSDPLDSSITKYRVRYKAASSFAAGDDDLWKDIADSDASTTQHTVSGLLNRTEYVFQIFAENEAGESAVSDVVTSTPMTYTTTNNQIYLYFSDDDTNTTIAASGRLDISGLTRDRSYNSLEFDTITMGTETWLVSGLTAGGGRYPIPDLRLTGESSYTGNRTLSDLAGDSARNYRSDLYVRISQGSGGNNLHLHDQLINTNTNTYEVSGKEATLDGTLSQIFNDEDFHIEYRFGSQKVVFSTRNPNTTGLVAPSPPGWFATTAEVGQVYLYWENPQNSSITKYQIRSKAGSSFSDSDINLWEDIPNSGASTNEHTVTSLKDGTQLTNGTEYVFQIRAVNVHGSGAASEALTATPLVQTPAKPVDLKAMAGNAQVTLSWTDPNDSTITKYQYQQKTGNNNYGSTWTDITGQSPITSHTVTSLTNGTTYGFRIRAVNSNGESPVSKEVTVTPVAPPKATNELYLYFHDDGTNSTIDGSGSIDLSRLEFSSLFSSSIDYLRLGHGNQSNWWAVWGGGSSSNPIDQEFYDAGNINITGADTYTGDSEISRLFTSGNLFFDVRRDTKYFGIAKRLRIGGEENPGSRDRVDGIYSLDEIEYQDGGETKTQPKKQAKFNGTLLSTLNDDDFHVVISASGIKVIFSTRDPNPTVPEKPANLTATQSGSSGTVDLSWNKTTDSSVTGYQVRSKSGTSFNIGDGGLWQTIANSNSDTTSHTVTGSTNNTLNVYQIRAINNIGDGRGSDTATATPTGVPVKPAGLTASAGSSGKIELSWTDPGDPNITKYRLRYKEGSDFADSDSNLWGDIPGSSASTTSHSVTGLTVGTQYVFQISAVNSDGESEASDTVTGTVAGGPAAPATFTATAGKAKVDLSWANPNDPNVTGYQLRYKAGATFAAGNSDDSLWSDIANSDKDTISHSVTQLTNETEYVFQVRAVIVTGTTTVNGTASQEITATPTGGPSKPTNFTLTAGHGLVVLTWDDPGDSTITKYQIRHKAGSNFADGDVWTDIPSSDASTTNHRVQGLTNGTQYVFQVRAVRGAVEGEASDEKTMTPVAVPAAPSNLTTVTFNAKVVLNWAAAGSDSNIVKYRYRVKAGTTFDATDDLWSDIPNSSKATDTLTLTSLTDGTNLINGTAYVLQIRSVNASGLGIPSSEITATPKAVPLKPTNLGATTVGLDVQLSWDNPSDSSITGYEVRYKQASSFASSDDLWTAVTGSDNSTTTHTVTVTETGKEYVFQVRAVNTAGDGEASDEKTIKTLAKPANFGASVGNAQIALSWDHPGDDSITGYQVRHKAGTTFAAGDDLWTAITGSDKDTNTHTVTGLTNDTDYVFQVRAVYTFGLGAASDEVTEKPETKAPAPVIVSMAGDRSLTVRFLYNNPGVTCSTSPIHDTAFVFDYKKTGSSYPWRTSGTNNKDGGTFEIRNIGIRSYTIGKNSRGNNIRRVGTEEVGEIGGGTRQRYFIRCKDACVRWLYYSSQ